MIWQKTTANTPNLAELENMKLPKLTPENLPTVRPYLPTACALPTGATNTPTATMQATAKTTGRAKRPNTG